ncbi:hypothetical protein RvY_01671 [Ramazzottius varieornatus]|uniref:Rho GTPase-activating protein 39 n=1 Tax=Ramazzottius varieornatus TaxID=947166 RepID=A0A1D1UHD0_RAMVA|nr:hypothetical protein RvY_01671 [Ramazzottius varieornatus]
MEWVEIIEPKTKKHMYANLITGECVWEQPLGQPVKKTDDNQWWELYDSNTGRFYYYNATTQITVWHRPENCDIIPLAKLQTLKQNTEVRDNGSLDSKGSGISKSSRKRDAASTQTSAPHPTIDSTTSSRHSTTSSVSAKKNVNPSHAQSETATPLDVLSPPEQRASSMRIPASKSADAPTVKKLSSETQTTPHASPKDSSTTKRSNHHHHHHHGHKCTQGHSMRSQTTREVKNTENTSLRNLPLQPVRQVSTSSSTSHQPQRRPMIGLDDSFLASELNEGWNGGGQHDILMGSLPRNRLYENSGLAESEHRLPAGVSSSFRHAPPVVVPRRQRSFDYKNEHPEAYADGSLPFRPNTSSRNDLVPGFPTGIRSVESTPRVQRRNNAEAPLPQINEVSSTSNPQVRQHQDAFVISGGTPMQSRKRRSIPKVNNGFPSSNPSISPLAPTPSTPSSISQASAASQSSLESTRSLKDRSTPQPSSGFPVFSPPFITRNDHILSCLSPPQREVFHHPEIPESLSTFQAGKKPVVQLRRTISIDRPDAKSPEVRPMVPFSPQLIRRNTTKAMSPKHSPHDTDVEDRKAEALLRATEKVAKAFEMSHSPSAYQMSNQRYPEPSPAESRKLFTSSHSDVESNSDDNDADVEESDEVEEVDDEDDDCEEEEDDEIMALDASGQNRYGHLSPSQLRMHPNYYAVDRGIKSLQVDRDNNELDASSDEDTRTARPSAGVTFRNHQPSSNLIGDTRHASLRRKVTQPSVGPGGIKLSALEKSQSVQTELSAQQQLPIQGRPLSIVLPAQSQTSLVSSTHSASPVCRPFYPGPEGSSSSTLTRQRSYGEYAADPDGQPRQRAAQVKLNDHTKGIFRKKVSISSLLSWSKDAIQKPLIMTIDKSVKKEACSMFRLVQMYMGDRKAKEGKSQDEMALDLTRAAWQKATLRDELFIQMCKQTTDNRKPESLRRGWELMAICLAFFPPSASFYGYLHTYISRFQSPACDTYEVQVSHYAGHCLRRLERMSQTGAKRGVRKPTVEEIQQARVQIFHPSMFGNTLEDVMQLQKERYPDRKLPWIQTTLSEEVRRLNGMRTEGIFRVPGDIDEVNMLKVRMDRWNSADCNDPHVPTSLLKLWYRELYEPLIPASVYDLCVQNCNNSNVALRIVDQLPHINRLVLTYLIRFLQEFSEPENAAVTKMDAANLAMVMAPNCLRCMSDDPQVIFENTRKEMAFIRTLMQHLDTTWIDGVR